MTHRCAILDDYQNVALALADWSGLKGEVDFTVFNAPLGSPDAVTRALQGFDIVVLMRERTPFTRALIEGLPDLKLLVTTGMVNRSIDVAAAQERGITVCGTPSFGNPTSALAIGLMLELTRHIGFENARLKAGAPWISTLGSDIEGKTFGVVGLGRLGTRTARVAQALGMNVIAWSTNLTEDKCREAGVGYASKEDLFAQADVISIHLILSPRSRGIVGAADIARMKPSAYLINTARGPLVDEAALVAALREKRIAGAGLDVFETEPLPLDHPLRSLDNVVLTPHVGYATRENHETQYRGAVEAIRAWLDGKPIRTLA